MNFLGIGSGLELKTMMESLVRVASEPKVKQLGAKEVEAKESISGLGSLSGFLAKLQDAADALKSSSSFNARSVDITQPSGGDIFTADASTVANVGSYDVTVEKLARGSKGYTSMINSDSSASLTFAGVADANGVKDQLTFSLPDGSVTAFSIDLKDSMSLENIRDEINNHENNFGVTASIINGRLVYDSEVSGEGAALYASATHEKDLNVSVSQWGNRDYGLGYLSNFVDNPGYVGAFGTYTEHAQKAEITVDGITITGDDNVFDAEIPGLTITATKADPGNSAVLSVGLDSGGVKSKIEAFVSAYNELREGMSGLKGVFDEDDNFIPGKLSGDPILRNLESVLSGAVTQQVSGAASGMDTLYSVGLDIQSDGSLQIDSERLNEALSVGYDDLGDLFSGTDGLAYKLSETIDNYIGFTGVIKGKEDSYNEILKGLEEEYEAHARYIESYQATLQKQFAALDSTVGRLNSTMSYIGPQLAALSNISYSSS